MGFQTQVNSQQAPAVAGDFASANPRASVLADEGGLVAGAGGVTVGKFAWRDGQIVHSHGTLPAAPAGFVHREQNALIATYLAEYGVVVPEGFPVTLFNQGDFWAKNDGSGAAEIGDQVYARYSDGAIGFSSWSNAVVTGSIGSTNTASLGSTNTALIGATFTASAHGDDATQIDITAVTGLISVGDTLSGTGITAGTVITAQVSGDAGGAGTYQLDKSNTCSSATVTAFGSVLKVTSCTGLISVGDTVSGGAGFPAAATVETQVSGTPGGAGIYTLSDPATAYVASASGVTTFGNVIKVTACTGLISVGDTVSGGAGFHAGATIASQVSGTSGGIGVYELSDPGTAYTASASGVTTFGDVLNVTAVSSGALSVGDPVSGSGIPSDSVISAQLTGTAGSTGTYTIDQTATAYAAGTTVTATGGVSATGWKAASDGAAGELVKITTWA